jgi:hypothetical protein
LFSPKDHSSEDIRTMAYDRADQEIRMDSKALYREETFTDRRVGTLQRLTPIDSQGNPDPARPVLYVGQTQVLTPAGALPLSFEVEAASLEEAVGKFGSHAEQALMSTMKRLEEMRREAASSIIVPGSGGMPPQGGGIQMR